VQEHDLSKGLRLILSECIVRLSEAVIAIAVHIVSGWYESEKFLATVRLFAAAADVIGREELTVEVTTTGELRAELMSLGGITVQNVISRCSLLVDGARASHDEIVLSPSSQVDVLPPFAGG